MEAPFLQELKEFSAKIGLPQVSIKTSNLTVVQRVPTLSARGPASLPENLIAVARKLVLPLSTSGTEQINLLDNVTLDLPAGSSTLILGAPGSGKSSLLRALGGRLPGLNPGARAAITYNGLNEDALAAAGAKLNRLTAYAPQQDEHQQFLTPYEVLQFAHASCIAEAGMPDELKAGVADRVNKVVELLGLTVCKDVKMAMGVSGGQKRRTTIGEALLSGARVLLGDEITNGLDAAVAIQVVSLLVNWAKSCGGTFVTALQAPPPEIFALFDKVVLLSEGKVLYDGPPSLLEGYFRHSLGYHMTLQLDVADYAISVATSPLTALGLYQQQGVQCAADGLASASTFGLPMRFEPVGHHISSLADHWLKQGKDDVGRLTKAAGLSEATTGSVDASAFTASLSTTFAKAQYGGGYAHSVWRHTALLFKREGSLYLRNIGLIMAKLQQSLVLSLIFGGVFYQVPFYSFFLKVSILFFTLIFVSFSNIAEVPLTFENKRIVQRQLSNGAYPAFSYVLALIVVQLPIILLADMILSLAIYWMVGFINSAGNFFFFYFVIVAMDLSMTALFKLYAILAPSEELAGVAAGAGTGLMLVYGGFFVPRQQLITEGQTIPFYYFSPFSWALRSLSLNEFMSAAWDVPAPGAGQPYPGAPPAGTSFGQYACQVFGLFYTSASAESTAMAWKISGPFVLLGYFVLFGLIGCSLAFAFGKPSYALGTRRLQHQQQQLPAPLTTVPAVPAPSDAKLTIRIESRREGGADASSGPGSVFSPTAIPPPTPLNYDATATPDAAAEPTAEAAAAPNDTPRSAAVVVEEAGSASAAAPPAPAEAVTTTAAVPAATAGKQDISASSSFGDGHHTTTTAHGSLPFVPATLAFKDLTYSVPNPKTKGKTQIELLRGINGICRPGSLSALMGASGAGKTTLMDCLANRKSRGTLGGIKTVNGKDLTAAEFAKISGYGEQFDEALPNQTVHESLLLSAQLRMSASISQEQRLAHVEGTLEMMELTALRNRTVESLAPGERKRLTLGLEIAANPSILFADEPTTGLDARAAASVVRALHRIANTGRTVVVTIHMPSSSVFLAFSDLILLAPGGYQIYAGPLGKNASSLSSYLEKIPGIHPLPPKVNAATWMLEQTSALIEAERDKNLKAVVVAGNASATANAATTAATAAATAAAEVGVEMTKTTAISIDASPQKAASKSADAAATAPSTASAAGASVGGGILAAHWNSSPQKASQDASIAAFVPSSKQQQQDGSAAAAAPVVLAPSSAPDVTDSSSASFLKQVFLLTLRGMVERWRSEITVIRVLVFIFVGIFFAVSFLGAASVNPPTQASGLAKIGVAFSVTVFCGIASFNSGLPSLFKVRPTFYRERAAHFYHPLAYFFSLCLSDLPFLAFYVLLYSSLSYFAVGFIPTAGPFFSWCLALLLLLRWYEAIALWISAFLPNQQVAQIIAGVTITFTNLFAGINIPPNALPPGWLWILQINGLSKLLQFNSMVQFDCNATACPTTGYVADNGQVTVETPLAWASNRLNISYENRWNPLGWLVLITVVFYILGGLGYWKIVHQKR